MLPSGPVARQSRDGAARRIRQRLVARAVRASQALRRLISQPRSICAVREPVGAASALARESLIGAVAGLEGKAAAPAQPGRDAPAGFRAGSDADTALTDRPTECAGSPPKLNTTSLAERSIRRDGGVMAGALCSRLTIRKLHETTMRATLVSDTRLATLAAGRRMSVVSASHVGPAPSKTGPPTVLINVATS